MSASDFPTPAGQRLVVIATGDIALPAFRYLLEHGPRPLALVTQPDKPVGRHQKLTPPRIKTIALAAGIPVLQPVKIAEAAELLHALEPELLVVVAYGQILPPAVLTIASQAIINLHASLLPRYRGAACIQAAIAAGDATTGVTAIHVVRELDAGDVICAKPLAIAADETGGSLHDRLAGLAVEVLAEVLRQLAAGSAVRIPQDVANSSYVPKLQRADGRLDWTQPAAVLERQIRAYDPWPGTFTSTSEEEHTQRLKIHPPTAVVEMLLDPGQIVSDHGRLIVGCGHHALEIFTVQPDGGKRMSASAYLRGRKPAWFQPAE